MEHIYLLYILHSEILLGHDLKFHLHIPTLYFVKLLVCHPTLLKPFHLHIKALDFHTSKVHDPLEFIPTLHK